MEWGISGRDAVRRQGKVGKSRNDFTFHPFYLPSFALLVFKFIKVTPPIDYCQLDEDRGVQISPPLNMKEEILYISSTSTL